MQLKTLRRKILDWLLRRGYKLTRFEPRPMIKACREYFGDNEVRGAEIGVWIGDHAQEILTALNVDKLFLIDPYIAYEDFTGLETYSQERLDTAKKIAHKRIKGYWVDRTDLPEGLDFIYIDGNHSYKSVMADIELALQKVEHGIIGGHDYSSEYPDVIKAVKRKFGNEFQFVGNDWWAVV